MFYAARYALTRLANEAISPPYTVIASVANLLVWQLDDHIAGTLHYEQAAMLFMQPSNPQALTFYLHCQGPQDCPATEHTIAV